jgi:hypothetical protein
MSSRNALVFLFASLLVVDARADHDPYEFPIPHVTPTPDGGIAPRASTRVQLRSASIEIDLNPSPQMSVRRITYALTNPGDATTVRVGFRFSWYSEHRRSGTPENQLEPLSTLSLEGVGNIACDDFSDVRWADVPRRRAGGPSGLATAWCSFELRVPRGDFEWKFTATDTDTTDIALGTRNAAAVYSLAAEAAWPGHPSIRVVVTPVGGWRRPLLPVSPAGARIDGGRITWDMEQATGGVVVSYDRWETARAPSGAGAAPGAPTIVGGTGFTVAASSTLAPQGRMRYDGGQVVDGDQATAWCEGVPGPGQGEWLEVRTNLDPVASARCQLEAFSVIPGYARSDESWARNGRLRRFRITSCADPTDGFETDVWWSGQMLLYPNPTLKGSSSTLKLLRDPPFKTENGCFRLTILDVTRGKDPDTCVSEFMPVLRCAP